MTDVVLKTIIAEAGGDPKAMAAVAAVINNRAIKEGKTPEQIVKARGQFEGYSNPGPASVKAQHDAKVVARAQRVWTGVKSGTIADPTNGARYYHADYVSPYWAKSVNKHGTVNIGGNIFYKGSSKSAAALAAIDKAVPPLPQARPTLAYANTSATAKTPPLPIPRPNTEGFNLAPPNLPLNAPIPQGTGRYWGPNTDRWGPGFQSASVGTTPQVQAGMLNRVSPPSAPSPDLTSRSVQTVAIDPYTGAPLSQQQQLQKALDAYAANRADPSNPANRKGDPAAIQAGQKYAAAPLPKVTFVPSQAKNNLVTNIDRAASIKQAEDLGSRIGAMATPTVKVATAAPKTTATPTQAQLQAMRAVPAIAPAIPPSPVRVAAVPGPNAPVKTTDRLPQGLTPEMGYGPALPAAPAAPAITAINNAVPLPRVRPNPIKVPAIPIRAPAQFPLSSFNTVNPTSQIGPQLGAHFNTTPAGHLLQLFTGQPVQGGLLRMLLGGNSGAARVSTLSPSFNVNDAAAGSPIAQATGSHGVAGGGVFTAGQQLPSSMNNDRWNTGY